MSAENSERRWNLSRGSKSLRLALRDGVGRATIRNDTGRAKINGETTFLYQRSGAIFQALADRTGREITERFGSVNPTMKAWMRDKGVGVLGFKIVENKEDGRTMKAERKFSPRVDKR